MMEWLTAATESIFTTQFLLALGAIIVIDIVLAGDNAIVIALAARNLPPHLQKKAIVWGTVGAVVVRTLMTLVVVWLLKIPGLLLVGGLGLLWIAHRLLSSEGEEEDHGAGATSFAAAIRTIVIADAVMGVDNVLAVAGAAKGNFLLVVLGLLISVPIMVWGSRLILRWMERFPIILYIGAGVLIVTAVGMVFSERLLQPYVEQMGWLRWVAYPVVLALLLGPSWRRRQQSTTASPS